MAIDTTYELPIALVISKNPTTPDWFKQTLHNTFYVVSAHEEARALEILKTNFVEILIIEEAFLQICKEIRSLKNYAFVPILLITSNLEKNFLFQALNEGVSDFLNFPLEAKEVFQRFAVARKAKRMDKKTVRIANRIKEESYPSSKEDLRERFLLNDVALKEIAKAKTEQHPLSMLMIEVDGYTSHLEEGGETIATGISHDLRHLLQKQMRPLDSLFPQGGGRFIALLPKTSERAAHLIAENIRLEVSSHPISTRKGRVTLTVSIGLVSYDRSSSSKADPYQHLDQMLETVSRALIQAKKKGNNIISGGLS